MAGMMAEPNANLLRRERENARPLLMESRQSGKMVVFCRLYREVTGTPGLLSSHPKLEVIASQGNEQAAFLVNISVD
ncbi:MAG: hypothetical protein IPP88_06840 [Betaproteobacteria bacterium]|nr:hypothetical protein [Betaproteobacteria bacterium]